MPRTLYDKIWDEHVVHTEEDGTAILYIDRHLVHEVTSPQAFAKPDARFGASVPSLLPLTTTRQPPAGNSATTASRTPSAKNK